MRIKNTRRIAAATAIAALALTGAACAEEDPVDDVDVVDEGDTTVEDEDPIVEDTETEVVEDTETETETETEMVEETETSTEG